ncbi:MAG: hypothetical protein QOG07_3909, partial [Pseudonocardiales bacterium]|nr:hypothetical protein [Pseudonocardiales bacterium]
MPDLPVRIDLDQLRNQAKGEPLTN